MELLELLLVLVAVVCFGLAAFNVVVRRIHLIALGLMFWALSVLLGLFETVA